MMIVTQIGCGGYSSAVVVGKGSAIQELAGNLRVKACMFNSHLS